MNVKRLQIVCIVTAVVLTACFTLFHDELFSSPEMIVEMLPEKTKSTIHKENRRLGSRHDSAKDDPSLIEYRLTEMLRSKSFPKRGDVEWQEFVQGFLRFTAKNPSKTLEILNAASVGQPRGDVVALNMFYAQGLATADPYTAIKWASSLEDEKLKEACLDGAFLVWTQNKNSAPIDILNELKQYASKDWAQNYFTGMIRSLASQNVDLADRWIMTNLSNNPNLYYSSLVMLFSEIGKNSPKSLIDSIQSYDIGGRKDGMISGVVNSLASSDLEKAMEFVRLASGEDYENAALAGLAGESFQKNPDEILKMIMSKSPKNAVDIYGNGVSQWIYNDATIANSWMERQTMNLRIDLARAGIPQALASKQPELAIAFVEKLDIDPADKSLQYQGIAEIWAQSDPVKSISWISSLDPDVQSQVILGYVNSLSRESRQMVESFLSNSNISKQAKIAAYDRLNAASRKN